MKIERIGMTKEDMLDRLEQSDNLTKESVATIIYENNKVIANTVNEVLKELGRLR